MVKYGTPQYREASEARMFKDDALIDCAGKLYLSFYDTYKFLLLILKSPLSAQKYNGRGDHISVFLLHIEQVGVMRIDGPVADAVA